MAVDSLVSSHEEFWELEVEGKGSRLRAGSWAGGLLGGPTGPKTSETR